MIRLGKKSEMYGVQLLRKFHLSFGWSDINGRPVRMPPTREGEKILCGQRVFSIDDEEMYVCESIEDMQTLYDKYATGWTYDVNWYYGPDPGFLTVIVREAE